MTVEGTRDELVRKIREAQSAMDAAPDVRSYIAARLDQLLFKQMLDCVCPRCDLGTDDWCLICGDSPPWPHRNEPLARTRLRGIRP